MKFTSGISRARVHGSHGSISSALGVFATASEAAVFVTACPMAGIAVIVATNTPCAVAFEKDNGGLPLFFDMLPGN